MTLQRVIEYVCFQFSNSQWLAGCDIFANLHINRVSGEQAILKLARILKWAK